MHGILPHLGGSLPGESGFAPDIAGDFRYVDGLQPMTLRARGKADVDVQALAKPWSTKEMEASNGQVLQGDSKLIWSALTSDRPPLGSVLIDADGTPWTILNVDHKPHVQLYVANCRNLSIAGGFNNHATILRATYHKGQAGDPIPDWKGAISGLDQPTAADTIAARFQPSAEAAQLFLGAEYTKTTYRVILARQAPIELAGGEYRLVDAQGWRYRVMEYIDQERLDVLPVAIAVKILEGAEYWDHVELGLPVPPSARATTEAQPQRRRKGRR